MYKKLTKLLQYLKKIKLILNKNFIKIIQIINLSLALSLALLLIDHIITPSFKQISFESDIEQKIFWVHPDWTAKNGGTGVLVQAPSGNTYLLTNSHICDRSKNGMVYIKNSHYPLHERLILSNSLTSDLCVIQWSGPEQGFKLNTKFKNHEPIIVVGHPLLKDLTISTGYISSLSQRVELIDFIIKNDDQQCNKPKQFKKLIPIEFFGIIVGEIKACMLSLNGVFTTAPVRPGSSGSPVFNKNYEVIGLIFAGVELTNWSIMVPASDIVEFLKSF